MDAIVAGIAHRLPYQPAEVLQGQTALRSRWGCSGSRPGGAGLGVALLAVVLLLVVRAHAAPVLPPDASKGFSAVMGAVNEGKALGDGVALENVSIDKAAVRLTFVFHGADEVPVALGGPDGSGAPVGRWFRVREPPEDARLAALLPRLGTVLDGRFEKSPWVDAARADAPEHPMNSVVLFWSLLILGVAAWAIHALRVGRKRSGRADDRSRREVGPDRTAESGDASGVDDEASRRRD